VLPCAGDGKKKNKKRKTRGSYPDKKVTLKASRERREQGHTKGTRAQAGQTDQRGGKKGHTHGRDKKPGCKKQHSLRFWTDP